MVFHDPFIATDHSMNWNSDLNGDTWGESIFQDSRGFPSGDLETLYSRPSRDESSSNSFAPTRFAPADGPAQQWNIPRRIPTSYTQFSDPFCKSSNEFSSSQAAQALQDLLHSGAEDAASSLTASCCLPCDQQCNVKETTDCYWVEEEPCYDQSCSQICEFDGMDTLCSENHPAIEELLRSCAHDDCNFNAASETALLQHCTDIHSCTADSSWQCRERLAPVPFPSDKNVYLDRNFGTPARLTRNHDHFFADGCINPAVLHEPGCSKRHAKTAACVPASTRSQPVSNKLYQHSGPSSSYSSHQHLFDPTNHNHISTGHFQSNHKIKKEINQAFSEHTSRETSLSIAPAEHSINSHDIQPLPLRVNELFEGSPTPEIFKCEWIAEGCSKTCGCTFGSAFELQAHVEDNHLILPEESSQKKISNPICQWQGCQYRQIQKKWRQVQHLKDHIRTHTKRKFSLFDT
jgi:hypothetical protein